MSDTRQPYEDLAGVYLPVAVAVFVVVLGALVIIAIRFRSSRRTEPSPRVTSQRLEVAFAALLAVVAGLLLWRSYLAIDESDAVARTAYAAPQAGPAGLTIGVVGSRWNWRFSYPDGVVQTGDGRERTAILVVPEGVPVRFRISSADVIHAFWIPALYAKFDAFPGRVNVFDLQFARGLDYTTARCSEFCGVYHDQMRFRVNVRPPAAFDRWLAARQAGAPA